MYSFRLFPLLALVCFGLTACNGDKEEEEVDDTAAETSTDDDSDDTTDETTTGGDDTETTDDTDDTETTEDTDTTDDSGTTEENHAYAVLPAPTVAMATEILGDYLYTYGGTTAPAHTENNEVFISETRRLDLTTPGAEWETIAGSDMATQQGRLFTYDGRLYRVGGLIATNAPEEPADLWSIADFAVYDEGADVWESLPDMPDTRASNSIGVHDGVLYVMGGWKMEGGTDSWAYYETWLSIDLTAEPLVWDEHNQPFQVRDHCGGAVDGKVYLIGGMLSGRFPTEPYVYDIATGEWEEGPTLPIDHAYKGFGCAASVVDDTLYFSAIDGIVYRLKDDHSDWEVVVALDPARTFHSLPARSAEELLVVGGGTGNSIDAVDTVESVMLSP